MTFITEQIALMCQRAFIWALQHSDQETVEGAKGMLRDVIEMLSST